MTEQEYNHVRNFAILCEAQTMLHHVRVADEEKVGKIVNLIQDLINEEGKVRCAITDRS